MSDNNGQNKVKMDQLLNKINAIATNSVQNSNSFAGFIDDLIKEKGFVGLEPEVMTELRNQMLKKLDDFVAAKVIAALSDEDVKKFEVMLRAGSSNQDIQKFTTEHIPDFVNFLTNALLEFRGVYLGIIHVPAFVDVDFTKMIKKEEAPLNPPPAPINRIVN